MQIAVLASLCMILVAHILIKRRPLFRGFSCLRAGGKIREKIVRVERRLALSFRASLTTRGEESQVLTSSARTRDSSLRGVGAVRNDFARKLLNEIKIFNRMRLVMPCRRGVPVLYSQFLGRLVLDSKWIYGGTDAVCRFLYVCAAANLYNNEKCGLVRRQLMKNQIYVFGMSFRAKGRISGTLRLGKNLKPFAVQRATRFKYIGRQFVFAEKRQDRPSYTMYDGKKHYADKVLPVQCFEYTGERFSHLLAHDKFEYNLSHTSDTFYAIGERKAYGIYVPEKSSFGSSICDRNDDLVVHATSEGGKYFVITAKTKAEVTSIVGLLKKRRGKLDYLLTSEEAREVAQIESLFERAWASKFVRGDNLKEKWAVACKYVPTLFLPTLVFRIEQPDDFFAVVDSFKFFRKIAKTGANLNVVFLYSSMSDEVREVIKNFADKDEARELISSGVFLFFIDRIKADSKAVNYLSLMSDHVQVTARRQDPAKIYIPMEVESKLDGLSFGLPAICKKHGTALFVTRLKSGRTSIYKLPNGAVLFDTFGRVVEKTETACDKVFIQCSAKLAGLEEKILQLVRESTRIQKKVASGGELG